MKEEKIENPLTINLYTLHKSCQKSILPHTKTAYRCSFLMELSESYRHGVATGGDMSWERRFFSKVANACRRKQCNKVSEYLSERMKEKR